MYWELGDKEYSKKMIKKANRLNYAIDFTNDLTYDHAIRTIVGETFCKPESPVQTDQIHRLFKVFEKNTRPGARVPKLHK